MVITDIHGDYIKVGKSSITVKDNNGKTKGVVTNCITFSVMAPRDIFYCIRKTFLLMRQKIALFRMAIFIICIICILKTG